MSLVIGLDLSLTATGISTGADRMTVATKPDRPIESRIARISNEVCVARGGTDLFVIEDFVTRSPAASKLGMLHGVVRTDLWRACFDVLLVPPATLKTWATGKGNATKADMRMALYQRFDIDEPDDNRADAHWLWTLGMHVLGDPVVDLPKTHTRALDKLDLDGLEAA